MIARFHAWIDEADKTDRGVPGQEELRHGFCDIAEQQFCAIFRRFRRESAFCHDYPWASGVVKAIEEFFRDKPDPVIELTGYQAMIVKLERGLNYVNAP